MKDSSNNYGLFLNKLIFYILSITILVILFLLIIRKNNYYKAYTVLYFIYIIDVLFRGRRYRIYMLLTNKRNPVAIIFVYVKKK